MYKNIPDSDSTHGGRRVYYNKTEGLFRKKARAKGYQHLEPLDPRYMAQIRRVHSPTGMRTGPHDLDLTASCPPTTGSNHDHNFTIQRWLFNSS
jgi:hypothetical protein